MLAYTIAFPHQGDDVVSVKSPWGANTVSVTDLAGVDPTGVRESSVAIQAALDALVDSGALSGSTNTKPVRLFFPSGKYLVQRPIWLYDNVEACGEGLSSIVTSANVGIFPFMAWKRPEVRTGLPTTFASDHRFDLHGIMDSVAAPTTGVRYGLSSVSPTTSAAGGTTPDHFMAWLGTPLDMGVNDRWQNTRVLTVSIALREQGGGGIANGMICGTGLPNDRGSVQSWYLWAGGNTYDGTNPFHVYFRDQNGVVRDFSFGDRTVTGVRRIDFSIDFTANNASGLCKLYAATDGTQQAVTRGYGCRNTTVIGGEPSFTAADGVKFAENIGQPFVFDGNAYAMTQMNPVNSYAPFDLLGLHVLNSWPYVDNGAGLAQTRADAATITDGNRYFVADNSHTIALLPLTEPPADSTKTSDRLIQTAHGSFMGVADSYGFFSYQSDGQVVDKCSIRNISIQNANPYGGAVLCENAFGLKTSNVELIGGQWGLKIEGGFDYHFHDYLKLSGYDAALSAASALTDWHTDPDRTDVGRTFFRLVGCKVQGKPSIRTANLNAFGQTTESIVNISGGSNYAYDYELGGIETDNEMVAGPSKGLIVAQRENNFATYLTVEDVVTGNNAGAPVLYLDSNDAVAGPVAGNSDIARCWVRRIKASDGYLVFTNGNGWECVIQDSYPIPDFEPVKSTSTSGTYVKIRQRMRALPKAGRILAGTYYVELWNPAAGGVETYVCTTSGTAAWDASYTYSAGAYVCNASVEYKALVQNTNSPPPNANWQTLGAVTPPVWKALETAAP